MIKKCKYLFLSFSICFSGWSSVCWSHGHEETRDWKAKSAEAFSDAESNFKLTMKALLEKHVDKSLNKDDLFRAATAGMLASLNGVDESWNELLSPEDMHEMQIDLSGKVTGIGIELKFEESTGYGMVLKLIPGSAAEKSGLKPDDQILSVDGKKFKGKKFHDMVFAVRGAVGNSVSLKVLREDKIMTFNIKRESVPWTPVELEAIDDSTALLSIRFFNDETPKMVEQKIIEINGGKFKKLIVDVRDNGGGGFDQAIHVTELFIPKDLGVARTRNRDGQIEQFKSKKGLLNSDMPVILLTNKKTYSGAELFTAALKESRNVKIVGERTFGKWTAQTVEPLPNRFAIKYTVKEFQSPNGNSFQNKGVKPDLEVLLPSGVDSQDLRHRLDMKKRMNEDTQLKAALELLKTAG